MAEHIVHVGFHKTGTTWLQRHVFPTARGAVPVKGPVMRSLLRNLTDEDRFLQKTFLSAVDELGDGARLLLSFEALVGRPWGPNHPERTADRLAEVLPEARILIVVRDVDELRRALYAQYVNEGGVLSREAFQRSVLSSTYLDADAAVKRFESRFQRVAVLPYELLREDPREFLARVGRFADIELSIPPTARPENPSLGGWRLTFLRGWNRAFRESRFNRDPYVALPRAEYMRRILQGP